MSPLSNARALRRRSTHAEARLWQVLRDRRLGGWKWRRQVPVEPFVVDFLCVAASLVVEVDGATHADLAYDERRTRFLEDQGLRVFRVFNHSIYEDRAGVCDAILAACEGRELRKKDPSPYPLPQAGEDGGCRLKTHTSPVQNLLSLQGEGRVRGLV